MMFVCDRPVAAVTATTTTPNSIHKMSAEKKKKMTRFLSTVDSFLGAAPNMRQGGRSRWHGTGMKASLSLTCILAREHWQIAKIAKHLLNGMFFL